MWEEAEVQREKREMIDPHVIEVCAVAERALNYMHTGSAKVLATRVMNPLWTALSLLETGLPMFNPAIVRVGATAWDNVTVCAEQWPCDPNTHRPYGCSNKSQISSYGQYHFSVSVVFPPSPGSWKGDHPPNWLKFGGIWSSVSVTSRETYNQFGGLYCYGMS
jgi:hypothetical protein